MVVNLDEETWVWQRTVAGAIALNDARFKVKGVQRPAGHGIKFLSKLFHFAGESLALVRVGSRIVVCH